MTSEAQEGKHGSRQATTSRVVHALHSSWDALVQEVEAGTTDEMLVDAPRALECDGQLDVHELTRRRLQMLKQEVAQEAGVLSLMLMEDSQTGIIEESLVRSIIITLIG